MQTGSKAMIASPSPSSYFTKMTMRVAPLLRLIASFLSLIHVCRSLATNQLWRNALCSPESSFIWKKLDLRFLPVSQSAVKAMIQRAGPSLMELRLDGLKSVDNSVLQIVSEQRPLPHLDLITLFGTSVTKRAIIDLCTAVAVNRVYAFDADKAADLATRVAKTCNINGLTYERCEACGKKRFCYNCHRAGCSFCAICAVCKDECEDAEFTWCVGCLNMYCSDINMCCSDTVISGECLGGCFRANGDNGDDSDSEDSGNKTWWCHFCAGWTHGNCGRICRDCSTECSGCRGVINLRDEREKAEAITCLTCDRHFCDSKCLDRYQRQEPTRGCKAQKCPCRSTCPCTFTLVPLSKLPLKFHGLLE